MDENKLDRAEVASDDVSGVETLSVEAEPAADSTVSVRSPWKAALTPALVLGVVAVWGWLSWLYAELTSYVVSAVISLVILAWLAGFFVQPRRRWLVRGSAVAVVGVLVAVPVVVDYQANRQGETVHAKFGPIGISMLPDGADQLRLVALHRMVGVNPAGSAAWTWTGGDLMNVWSLDGDLLLVSQFKTRLSVVGANDGVTRWAIDSDSIVFAASDGVVVVQTGWNPEVLTGMSIADGHQVWQTVGMSTSGRILTPMESLIDVNDVLTTRFTTTLRDGSTQVHDAATGEVTAVYPADVDVLLVGDSVFTLTQREGDCVMEKVGEGTPRTGNVDPVLCFDAPLLRLAGDYLVAELVGQILDLDALTSRPLREDEVLGFPAKTTTITQDSDKWTFRDLGSGEELWSMDAPPADSRVSLQGDRVLVAVTDDGSSGRFFSAPSRNRLKVYDARTGDLLTSVCASHSSDSHATDSWLLYQAPDEDNFRMLPLTK